jgi:Zn-finger nucleic acid-binding protein
MNCPICPQTVLVVSSREGIEIDYCPKCRGVWLDRNELDKIIERSVSAGETGERRSVPTGQDPRAMAHPPAHSPVYGSHGQPPPPRYYDPNDDSKHGYQYGKKRKSWLGELFD